MDKIATKEALSAVAQALNDKIAQQDYIIIPIKDAAHLTEDEIALLKKHIKSNTIWDCLLNLLEEGAVQKVRPLEVETAETDGEITYFCISYVAAGEASTIEYSADENFND